MGMELRVFVAAKFERRAEVRGLHATLRERGMMPTSRWANTDDGVVESACSAATLRRAAEANDRDVLSSTVVLVLASPEGGEHFCEARLALAHSIPVVWIGERRILTAYRRGVIRIATVDEALERLLQLRDVAACLCLTARRTPRARWDALGLARDVLWREASRLPDEAVS